MRNGIMTKEEEKRSTFEIFFYIIRKEVDKKGNVPIYVRVTIDGKKKVFSAKG